MSGGNTNNTNYNYDSEGKFIPASQRPDGTWRKARRVKDGYVPQEEVPLYESRGKQIFNRQSGLPVGLCPLVAAAAKEKREKQLKKQEKQKNPGMIVLPNSIPSQPPQPKTNKKKSQKKLDMKENTATTSSSKNIVDQLSDNIQILEMDDDQELSKKLKKLKKKMREINTIESKLKSGELKKPEQDQLNKVKRKKEILDLIKDLEERCPMNEDLEDIS